ncbi:twin-arginine translocation signal domain-containing protein, partial [Arthrobacter liuii]|uniref:twin-arginine translocation signal domain-containing protein n=1 Tax=Arthrobacter liuii TaxID=1476996 RepID=UPI00357132DE
MGCLGRGTEGGREVPLCSVGVHGAVTMRWHSSRRGTLKSQRIRSALMAGLNRRRFLQLSAAGAAGTAISQMM